MRINHQQRNSIVLEELLDTFRRRFNRAVMSSKLQVNLLLIAKLFPRINHKLSPMKNRAEQQRNWGWVGNWIFIDWERNRTQNPICSIMRRLVGKQWTKLKFRGTGTSATPAHHRCRFNQIGDSGFRWGSIKSLRGLALVNAFEISS